ncbi:MAG: sulfurtransferase TusA family protein [Deltaproteobacteria bacterium]
MPSTKKLDLTDTVSFLSLLKCRQELSRLDRNQTLEITTNDPEMVSDLLKIIERSNDRVLKRSLQGETIHITIGKGTREE